jgi:hypothetical protein
MVEAAAGSSLPELSATDDRHFAGVLNVLNAALPRQQADEMTGELRLKAYRRMLGHLPKEALNYAGEQALQRLDWFPTIKQLLDLAGEWERNDEAIRAQREARIRAYNERQLRASDERREALRAAMLAAPDVQPCGDIGEALDRVGQRLAAERVGS